MRFLQWQLKSQTFSSKRDASRNVGVRNDSLIEAFEFDRRDLFSNVADDEAKSVLNTKLSEYNNEFNLQLASINNQNIQLYLCRL